MVTIEQFAFTSQFDVKEPEFYNRVIQYFYALQWTQAMKKEFNFLHNNKTWDLISKEEIEPGDWFLGKKWVYKIKNNINSNIARFKAR